ncbi:hypothetical protein Vadar_000352 [Vaccinium darrowii]|uniref:Uncharacterized protein n=1 Tax=Vaccinium darrowii TaxID=229202 RepID=A0ACB7ZHF4_9ERIC|nr:hypothetical protein Vadar_000352 [Vaccinium darrowii]
MGCRKRNSTGNLPRRRSKRRKGGQHSGFSMAEARREVFSALHLHRSSSSSSSIDSITRYLGQLMHTSSTSRGDDGNIGEFVSCTYGSSQCHRYCYSVLDSLPLPQPTWSTTAPSIITISTPPLPPPPFPPPTEANWAEKWASSYACWMGFHSTGFWQSPYPPP